MTKKKVKTTKKKTVKKTTKKKPVHHSTEFKEMHVERTLVENFIALQKVMTNMSVKMDQLTNQVSKLLDLFELSAKAVAKKDFGFNKYLVFSVQAYKYHKTFLLSAFQ